jgi:hypothetical protein
MRKSRMSERATERSNVSLWHLKKSRQVQPSAEDPPEPDSSASSSRKKLEPLFPSPTSTSHRPARCGLATQCQARARVSRQPMCPYKR